MRAVQEEEEAQLLLLLLRPIWSSSSSIRQRDGFVRLLDIDNATR
jgi:hypothetical protein